MDSSIKKLVKHTHGIHSNIQIYTEISQKCENLLATLLNLFDRLELCMKCIESKSTSNLLLGNIAAFPEIKERLQQRLVEEITRAVKNLHICFEALIEIQSKLSDAALEMEQVVVKIPNLTFEEANRISPDHVMSLDEYLTLGVLAKVTVSSDL